MGAKHKLVGDLYNLNLVFNFNTEEKELLIDKGLPDDLQDFLNENNNSTDSEEYVAAFVDLLVEDSEYKWDRFKELYNLLKINPNLLVQDCGDLTPWNDLSSFEVPQSCNDRLSNLGSGWSNQDILDGNSPTVNLDRHSVTIQNLPDLNGDGFSTSEELFDDIRKNFPNYANGQTTVEIAGPDYDVSWTWNFFGNDINLWESENPVTTILNIDVTTAYFWNIIDDATVINSSYDSGCCWVFSTIKTPQFTEPYDGSHPVSGNRQFGLINNGDGTYEFYTKAADRGKLVQLLRPFAFLTFNDMEEIFYQITDDTWNNLMDNIVSEVNSHGGTAVKNSQIKKRPKWEDVKNKLRANAPLTSINCN